MLPGLTVPASLAVLLQGFRSCFRLRPFEVFCLLTVGMVTQTGLCTVTGMLVGAGMQTVVAHDREHRFFSTHAWSADQLGLVVARLIVATLLPAGAALDVAADDSLFRRRGTKVHGTFWTHDASQPGQVTARGNRWVIVGIVVALPFSCRPTCLPVLFRLWGGKGTTTPVELARTLVGLLARAFPDRTIHLVADAAYHGKPLHDLPRRVTWTTRIQRNGVLYQPAPPPTGKRGRPRTKGERIGTPAQTAAGAAWRRTAVARYGRTNTVRVAEVVCLWYGAFGNAPDGSSPRPRAPARKAGSCCCSPPTWPPRRAGHHPVRRQVEHRGRHRNREGPHGCRPGPQPRPSRCAPHRPLRDAHHEPGLLLVHPLRPPPRRHHHPAHQRALVHHQDRAVLRRHARHPPPHHHRRPISA
jgi:DDE superfamily endonuclease